jgi:hypothetical protein
LSWWAIIENARTFFERNAAGVSQNPKPLGRGGNFYPVGSRSDSFGALQPLFLPAPPERKSEEFGRACGAASIRDFIEGFWSFAKHILYNYRGIPKYHFPMYLKEVEYRFNHRKDNLFKLFISIYFGYVSH